MIAYDLQCANGHCFEGWFEDSGAFEKQRESELIHCPLCNNTRIEQLPSPFKIKKASSPEKGAAGRMTDVKALYRQMAEFVERHCEDVGADFAREALKIHYGAAEPRSIRGTSTKEEEKVLKEEKIPFMKLLLPRPSDKDA